MVLYEHEGKKLFEKYGIAVPCGVIIRSPQELSEISWDIFPCVLKAQVLQGKRGLNRGVLVAQDRDELYKKSTLLFSSAIQNEQASAVLLEEKISTNTEWYLSLTYSTRTSSPLLLFSFLGGSRVEEKNEMFETPIHPVRGFEEFRIRNFFLACGARGKDLLGLVAITRKLYTLFINEDARLAEINPLARREQGDCMALDAKVVLDDDASFRHTWQYSERTLMGRGLTRRETLARAIDQGEFYYRGTAGKYIEFDGDIACLFSGGGASISMMDALWAAGGRAANYTEYSGNPPREKVYELAKVVFSKPNLRGIWIVGGVANFTHIGETMAGIADALGEIRPRIPIVIRRAGPHENEGRRLMEEVARAAGLDLSWFGREISMTHTARILMDRIERTVVSS